MADVDAAIAGHFEPSCRVTFLSRCHGCGGPHPLARHPALAVEVCPDCGTPVVQPGQTIEVPAVITGWRPDAILARVLFALGAFLRSFAQRF